MDYKPNPFKELLVLYVAFVLSILAIGFWVTDKFGVMVGFPFMLVVLFAIRWYVLKKNFEIILMPKVENAK